MNTPPTFLPPTRAAEPNLGRGAENGAPDAPFSQVLASEMANARSAQASRTEADKPAPQEPPGRAESPGDAAGTEAAAATGVTAADENVAAPVPDAATLLGLALVPAGVPLPPPQAGTAESRGGEAAGAEMEGADLLAASADPSPRKGRQTQGRMPQTVETASPTAPGSEPAARGKDSPQATAMADTADLLEPAPVTKNSAKAVADGGFEQILHPALRAAAQTLQTAAPGHPIADAAQARLAPAVGSAAWGQALGDRIVWMASNAQQSATLTLNPPNLGPLQVVLELSNDQASASFYAAQPEVRQAIEAAFPRLKEMMSDAGIQLQQASVSADASPQQQEQAARQPAATGSLRFASDEAAAEQLPAAAAATRSGRGLVDTFA